jgi:Flp pilus assembly protein CpaB
MDGKTSRQIYMASLVVILGLATYSLRRVLRAGDAGSLEEVDMVVASHDLQAGTRLSEPDLTLMKVRATEAPSHAFGDTSAIVGRAMLLSVSKGMAIVPYEVGGYGDPIPRLGMRAVRVELAGSPEPMPTVRNYAHVDVTIIWKLSGRNRPTTVLKDVTVLAAGWESASDPGRAAEIVTLLLSPEDAAKIARAKSEGRILVRNREGHARLGRGHDGDAHLLSEDT